MDVREKLALSVCDATQKTNYKCDFNCEKKGKCAYCLVMAEQMIANGVTVQECTLPEQDYYVLRNMETGMYFRGKGVNRWGKHFNQATIYRVKGTAEHSIKEVAWHGEKAELVRIKIVEMPQPPKGE